MKSGGFLGGVVRAVARRTPAFDHDCRPEIAAELRRLADAYDAWHADAVAAIKRGESAATGMVRAYAVRDQLQQRADELDPQGGAR